MNKEKNVVLLALDDSINVVDHGLFPVASPCLYCTIQLSNKNSRPGAHVAAQSGEMDYNLGSGYRATRKLQRNGRHHHL